MQHMANRPGHTPRLRFWDYSNPGVYFVTITTRDRRPSLAFQTGGCLTATAAGRIVEECWAGLPSEFAVELDSLVIMPDHLHAILRMCGPADSIRPAEHRFRPLMAEPSIVLGKVIRSWKARSTRRIRLEADPEFEWQSRYYERVVRNEAELRKLREYVDDNPRRWCQRGAG
jgi:putative transposase